jgi:uncharacterized damage-inducible protein DinB
MTQQENAATQPQSEEEPWLRGTHLESEPVVRSLIYSIEMAREDIAKWCGGLDDAEIHTQPFHLPSVSSHLRHMAGSLNRLLTYAEGRALSDEQRAAHAAERDLRGSAEAVFEEFVQGLDRGLLRAKALAGQPLEATVKIGRRELPTTRAGLLIHVAEHLQRHVGQAITTTKVVLAQRGADLT